MRWIRFNKLDYHNCKHSEMPELDELVRKFISQMETRKNEDIDEWAENLANNVCNLND